MAAASEFQLEITIERMVVSRAALIATAWRRLDERQQPMALATVLKEVRFDPHGGTISITLAEDALNRLGRK